MTNHLGELKVVQWIIGSSLAWTDQYDKNAISYGKSHHHSEKWWRTFIRQCHVLGLVQKQLRSVIKKSEHYSIQGILVVQDILLYVYFVYIVNLLHYY